MAKKASKPGTNAFDEQPSVEGETKKTSAEGHRELRIAEAKLRADYTEAGEVLAKAKGWRLTGEEAVTRFLVDKYRWLPHEVRALGIDDLIMLLEDEEFRRLTSPK